MQRSPRTSRLEKVRVSKIHEIPLSNKMFYRGTMVDHVYRMTYQRPQKVPIDKRYTSN